MRNRTELRVSATREALTSIGISFQSRLLPGKYWRGSSRGKGGAASHRPLEQSVARRHRSLEPLGFPCLASALANSGVVDDRQVTFKLQVRQSGGQKESTSSRSSSVESALCDPPLPTHGLPGSFGSPLQEFPRTGKVKVVCRDASRRMRFELICIKL